MSCKNMFEGLWNKEKKAYNVFVCLQLELADSTPQVLLAKGKQARQAEAGVAACCSLK